MGEVVGSEGAHLLYEKPKSFTKWMTQILLYAFFQMHTQSLLT